MTAAPYRPAATTAAKPMSDKDALVKKSSKLISLHDMDNLPDDQANLNNKKSEENAPELSVRIRDFNQQNVIELWHMYAEQIKDTRGGVSALMNLYEPAVSDMTLTIQPESELQKTQFTQILIPLKHFLYSHLGIHPDIQIEVVKSADNSPKYYTPQDKLKRLIEINPALRRFQKELGLDLDYD